MKTRIKRRNILVLFLLISGVLLLVQYCLNLTKYVPIFTTDDYPRKYILYWTPMFGNRDFNLGLGDGIFSSCVYKNCYATDNRTLVDITEFDAILFHGVEYRESLHGKPDRRSSQQVYVYSNQESPLNTAMYGNSTDGFFNWTMTYRLDSDILRTYGYTVRASTNYSTPSVDDVEAKTRKVAWFVSNCHTQSKRERFVKEIQKYLPIDVYGFCGDYICPKQEKEKCLKVLEKDYKFYFAGENSICRDYATEKVFDVLKYNVVPIVYGGANYDQILPKNSVIDVTKFESVDALVKYLNFLDTHPEEYLKYFEWKKSFVIDTTSRTTLCSLCEKLHRPMETKVYGDLKGWWKGQGNQVCKTDDDLPEVMKVGGDDS